jgi:predicted acyltransferase
MRYPRSETGVDAGEGEQGQAVKWITLEFAQSRFGGQNGSVIYWG